MKVYILLQLLMLVHGMGNFAGIEANQVGCDDLAQFDDGIATKTTTGATTEAIHPLDEKSMIPSNQTTFYSYNLYATFSNRREMGPLTQDEETYFDEAIKDAFTESQLAVHKNIIPGANANITSVKIVQQSREVFPKNEKTNHGPHRGLRLSFRYYPYFYQYDYQLFFDFRCNLCGEKSGFWDRRSLRRREGEGDTVSMFEQILCRKLRTSPYKTFRGVQDCRIHFQ